MKTLQEIQKLEENGLRVKIVIPLMKAFGCRDVRDWHGNSENGIDVLFKSENVFKEFVHKGILLKIKDITKTTFDGNLRRQVLEAIKTPFSDPDYVSNRVKIHELIVMTSHDITKPAQDMIFALAGQGIPIVEMVDGIRLCGFINRLIGDYNKKEGQKTGQDFYEFAIDSFENFCERYQCLLCPDLVRANIPSAISVPENLVIKTSGFTRIGS